MSDYEYKTIGTSEKLQVVGVRIKEAEMVIYDLKTRIEELKIVTEIDQEQIDFLNEAIQTKVSQINLLNELKDNLLNELA